MEKTKEKNNREVIYDVIRVFSCIGIMIIHCSGFLMQEDGDNSIWWMGNIITTICFIGLPMFFVLSGALLLNNTKEDIVTFYKKRFTKIVIPFLIYSLIYIIGFEYKLNFEQFNIIDIFSKILGGNVYFHLWFVYSIMGIYLFTPFIRKMCQNINDKECKILFILILGVSIIKYLLPSFNINFKLEDIPFVGWGLYFILGYLLTKECIRKYYKVFYGLGILCFIFSIFAHRFLKNIENTFDLSIIMMFQVIAIFIFFTRNKEKLKIKRENVFIFLSKYSWEAYLIHGAIRELIYKINFLEITKISYAIITSIMLIILSYITAFILHNLVIKNIEKLLEILFKKIKKSIANIE